MKNKVIVYELIRKYVNSSPTWVTDVAREIDALYQPRQEMLVICPAPCDDHLKCKDRVPHIADEVCKQSCDIHKSVGGCVPIARPAKHDDGCIFQELKPEDCPACYPDKGIRKDGDDDDA